MEHTHKYSSDCGMNEEQKLSSGSSSECGLNKVQKLVGGKWKLSLLWYMSENKRRFGEIRRAYPDLTQSMLTKQLRELETDGLLHREVYREVPPKVEYWLTDLGKRFLPILNSMYEWGESNLK